jgi:hypothetical protein
MPAPGSFLFLHYLQSHDLERTPDPTKAAQFGKVIFDLLKAMN